MTNEQDFESTLQSALHDLAVASPPAPGLADRLIANASQDGAAVLPLRRSRRYTVPLLAAAVCILLIVGIVLGNHFLSSGRSTIPPATVQPTPSHSVAPTESRDTPSTATGSTAISASRTTALRSTPPQTTTPGTKATNPSWLTALPASTGAPRAFFGVAVDFLNTTTGWALGDAACPDNDKTSCPALIHTTDGGKTWSQLPVPKGLKSAAIGAGCTDPAGRGGSNPDTPCVNRVTFAGQEVGYLWSETAVYLTTNGGLSWTKMASSAGTARLVVFAGRIFRVHVLPQGVHGIRSALESAVLGATSFTEVSLPWAGQPGVNFSLVPAGRTALFVVDLGGTHQVFRTTTGAQWSRLFTLTSGQCGDDAAGALDGSLILVCDPGSAKQVQVVPAGSTSVGPKRGVPQSTSGSQALLGPGLGFGAVTSDRDFTMLEIDLDVAGVSWIQTHDGGKTWDPPLRFTDRFPFRQAGGDSTLVQVPGLCAGITVDGHALQFSTNGSTSWQVRSF